MNRINCHVNDNNQKCTYKWFIVILTILMDWFGISEVTCRSSSRRNTKNNGKLGSSPVGKSGGKPGSRCGATGRSGASPLGKSSGKPNAPGGKPGGSGKSVPSGGTPSGSSGTSGDGGGVKVKVISWKMLIWLPGHQLNLV